MSPKKNTRKRSYRRIEAEKEPSTVIGEGSGDNIPQASSATMDPSMPANDAFDPQVITTSSGHKFTHNMQVFLIRLMSEEVESGRAVNGEWNKTTWPNIQKQFNSYFQKSFTTTQLKQLGARLKKDYQTFQYLKSHTRFGWNEALKVPTAPLDKWEHVHRIKKNAMKFRTHTLANYDEMHKIWGQKNATGEFACNSTHIPSDDSHDGDASQQFSGDAMSTETPITRSGKGKSPASSGASKNTKRSRKERADKFSKTLDAISETSALVGAKEKALEKVYNSALDFHNPPPPESDPEGVTEIMCRLLDAPGIDDETWSNAMANLGANQWNRRSFVKMDDRARIRWIKHLGKPSSMSPTAGGSVRGASFGGGSFGGGSFGGGSFGGGSFGGGASFGGGSTGGGGPFGGGSFGGGSNHGDSQNDENDQG